MVQLNLKIGQHGVMNAAAVDADLQPGKLWGGAVPVWTPAAGSGLVVTPAADGFSALVSGTKFGTFAVTVSSADTTGAAISSSFNVVVDGNDATQFVFTPGAIS